MSINQEGMGRREFLVVSSVALASAAVAPKLMAGTSAEGPVARVALGYAPIDDARTMVAAADVTSSDGAFISRGARITVFAANAPAARGRRAVELLFNYSVFDGATRADVPFRAWAQGKTTSFTVPVDEQQKISLVVHAADARQSSSVSRRRVASMSANQPRERAMPVELTLLSNPGALKLARGYYAIAPLVDSDSEPNWSGYRVVRTPAGAVSLVDASGAAAPFEHVLIRVDYAAQ